MNSIIKDFLVLFAKPVLSKIHRFKDMHRGESCYLIGDGVSVKWFDLKAFSDKTALTCGYIPFHNDFSQLDVKYMSIAEPFWFYPLNWTTSPPVKLIPNKLQLEYRSTIKNNPDKEIFLNLSNFPSTWSKNITYLFRDIYDARLPENFITKRINAFHGSLRTSILLAIYLGFDHCYLVGFDYTHTPSRSHHWYEKGQGIFIPQEDYNKDFFCIAKEFIDITTITLDGENKYINSATYKKYTGREPSYRENNELLDHRYLKILSTWPGYTI